MAHFAELDSNNVVLRVIVADTKEWCEENLGGTWVQTSYNTRGGTHLLGGEPLHKNFAGAGCLFDGIGFYPPQPYASWTLDEETYWWEPPVSYPTDGKNYRWNESTLSWDEVTE